MVFENVEKNSGKLHYQTFSTCNTVSQIWNTWTVKSAYFITKFNLWKNKQETTWNNLQRARNYLKRPTTRKKQPTMTWTYLQRAKERCEITKNKQIFRLFYNMGQTVLFSNTFCTEHVVAVIRVLLHGESWWKQSVKRQLSCVFFTGYKIYFFLSGFCVSRETEKLLF